MAQRWRACITHGVRDVEQVEGKVALVTGGASGIIGSKIQAVLIARGNTVKAIARNAEKLASAAKVKVVAVDAADTAALANALRGHDAVICSVPFAPGLSESIIAAVKQSGV